MRQFKQIEFSLNVLLIAAFAVCFLFLHEGQLLFLSYFTIGAIQLIGMLVHAYNKWFTGNKSLRLYYHWLVVIMLLLTPLGIGLWILLYAAPVMALFYTYICWRELQTVRFKEFVHMK